ncbi:GIY-YIG nuclease family protein [Streptomyces nigrescens]|uniref:GIY-YIG nuclease family protein n=1 Tax=Streptomyces nigrescens TaxID=1920 RepID=A0A640T8K1_STRNI|nr:GIY-YIG nuclease family protein [Streptomyces libani]WAT94928.1 GIY-YIG nuclease family protein [Streptomyces libani subsp. libani]GFE20077.1 hypothetical protein Sliba_05300 [Streptomyces libani subsp. libani]GGV85778.1 hypothetical protein GCM10010500_02830 [Streptomyces libani subsp. libani]
MKNEWVYVLGPPGGTLVKIGRTINLAKRVAEIQRMSPVPLEILWSHPGGHELETNLHRHFAALRSHGEWFAFTEDPVARVRSAVELKPWLAPKPKKPKAPRAPRKPKSTKESRRAAFALRATPSPEVPEANPVVAARVGKVVALLEAIEDPVERYRAANRVEARWRQIAKEEKARIARALHDQGMSWREVGESLGGLSSQRAEQISRSAR